MIRIEKLDEVFCKIYCEDRGLLKELHGFFSFRPDGYQWVPSFKKKIWDGYIYLFNLRSNTTYNGLLQYIIQFCEERNYPYEIGPGFEETNLSLVEAKEWISYQKLPLEAREYQVDAFAHAVRRNRSLLLSPTGSGKSLVIYLLAQWYGGKTLVVVPTTSLVSQMAGDFESYGYKQEITQIQGGKSKEPITDFTCSTWQSIYKMPEEYFNQFECIIVDEVHLATANSLKGIMEKATRVKYRVGLTGTLDGTKCSKIQLESLFGVVKKVTTSKELIEDGTLSDIEIKSMILQHKKPKPMPRLYQDEIKFIIEDTSRNRFVQNLALSLEGITLVLFDRIDHGKMLHENIKKKADWDVHLVYGDVDAEVREGIRKYCETATKTTLVCSFGTTSTGVNIPRINNIIFAHPSKSQIRVLQSIGRGLRKTEDKEKMILFDIVDNLNDKNYAIQHYKQRYQYYKKEKFKLKSYQIPLS